MNIEMILVEKYPSAEWSLTGDTYAGLEWLDESPKPTETELEALWPTVEYETTLRIVERSRQAAYQMESDPLFFKYQAGEGTQEEWLAKRAEIAELYPYPEPVEGN